MNDLRELRNCSCGAGDHKEVEEHCRRSVEIINKLKRLAGREEILLPEWAMTEERKDG